MAVTRLDQFVTRVLRNQFTFSSTLPLVDGLALAEKKALCFIQRAAAAYCHVPSVWEGHYDMITSVESGIVGARDTINRIFLSANRANSRLWEGLAPEEAREIQEIEIRRIEAENRIAKYRLLDISRFASDANVREYAKTSLGILLKIERSSDYDLPAFERANINGIMKEMGIL